MRAFAALCGLLSGAAASRLDSLLTPKALRAAGLGGPRQQDTTGRVVSQELVSGKVRGLVTKYDVQRFLGIPFAAPPVGELRWQPPQAAKKWEGTREALLYSKSCVQNANVFSDLTGVSEDCLYLNLWLPNRPAPAAGQKYAAMIFFYGGSWTSGSAMFPLYAGESLALSNNETVIVTVNYRLAALGFLGSDFLRASDGSTGNFGLQDQRMAMEWVRANADLLNVDTSRIMIFGESAGAGSTTAHLVAPRSRGLFTRAAMESGPFADWNSVTMTDAERRFAAVASHLNCSLPAGGVAAKATPAGVAGVQSCMRGKSESEVAAAMHHVPGQNLRGAPDWELIVDGVEFTDQVQALGAKGQIANVPVLLGTNKNEGTGFVDIAQDSNVTGLYRWIDTEFPGQPKSALDEMKAAYPVSDFKATLQASASWWTGSEMVGDAQMTCSARRTASYLSTLRGPSPASAFVYYFTHEAAIVPLVEVIAGQPLGVFHGSELALVYGQNEILTEKERVLSKQVRHYWTNFAYSGNPNVGRAQMADLPNWPAHVPATNLTLNLGLEIGTIPNLKGERCDMWDRLEPLYPV